MEPQPPRPLRYRAAPRGRRVRTAGCLAEHRPARHVVWSVLAGCVAMHLAFGVSVWLTLALAIPTGALMVRVFIVQHDCGHGSFFASRRANALVGRLCSLCTLTPFLSWGRQHALHHAEWNNLDRSDRGSDIYSSCLTVRAYLDLSPRQRLLHRLVRHPLLANLVLPPLVFLLLYRVPFDTPQGGPANVAPSISPMPLCSRFSRRSPCCWVGARCCWCMCRLLPSRRSLVSGCSRCSTGFPAPAGPVAAPGVTSTPQWTVRLVRSPAGAAMADRQHRIPPRPPSEPARSQLPAGGRA